MTLLPLLLIAERHQSSSPAITPQPPVGLATKPSASISSSSPSASASSARMVSPAKTQPSEVKHPGIVEGGREVDGDREPRDEPRRDEVAEPPPTSPNHHRSGDDRGRDELIGRREPRELEPPREEQRAPKSGA